MPHPTSQDLPTSQAASDPFASIARFYDLDLDGFDDDVALYLDLAARPGACEHDADVLELGCGTGRVAAALAGAGLRTVGVDLSPAMLHIARGRVHGLPVRLVEGDMRDLALGEHFTTVLIPLGGLQHLVTVDEIVAALATVAAHLAPGGRAAVDVESPHPDDWLPGPRPLLQHWTRPLSASGPGEVSGVPSGVPSGVIVTKLVAVESRPAEALRLVTYHFDVQSPEGPLQRVTQQFPLRVITAGELELAARLARLRVAAWYGDYDGAPVREGDERLIAVFEHDPDGAAP